MHFDVILPTIGRPSLKVAIESVAKQEYRDFSLRIVSDGAFIGWPGEEDPIGWQAIIGDTRHTVELLGKCHGDYGAAARNTAVRQEFAKAVFKDEVWGQEGWVAYIDDDDVWLPNHLTILSELGRLHPEANMLRTIGQSFSWRHKSPRSSKLVRKLGPVNSQDILTVGMAHTREIFNKTTGWQPVDNHDHLLWREMLAAGGVPAIAHEVTFEFER